MNDEPTTIAERINATLTPVADAVSAVVFFSVDLLGVSLPLVVVWLMLAGLVLTLALGLINIRGFGHGWKLLFTRRGDPNAPGEITHFQALSAALSGTIGLGNIASVPVALTLGGPGALFWMVVAGFFGMSAKFAECALAVKYRRVLPDGRTLGGPMLYIEAVFARLGMNRVGKTLAVFFALMAMGASVSVFQVNQAHAQFANVTTVSAPVVFGVIMASAVAAIVLGGIRRVGAAARLIVPAMGLLYVGAALTILALNVEAIPGAVSVIFAGAFGLDAAGGGIVGALINGMKRATYSSEAGVGSAAIAHSAVKTREPLTEGYVALLEPFIDTIVVCTLTGLVVVVTGVYEPFLFQPEAVGIEITSAAFAQTFSWFPYLLLVASLLFAFSTLVSWAFYGSQAAAYLFGPTRATDVTFKLVLCLLLSTGAAISLSAILNFIDSMLFAMAVPNVIALYLLLPELRRDVEDYRKRGRPAG